MISVWWCRVLYHKVYIDNTVLYHCMVLAYYRSDYCWGILKNDVNPYLKASWEGNNAVGRNKTRGGRLDLFLATIMVFALQHKGCLRESCS